VAVKAFLHYALEVPDPTVGQRYYRDFGLADAGEGGSVIRLRAGRQQRENVLLYAGAKKRLHHLCFGAPGPAFVEVRASLARAGVKEVDPPRDAPEGGLWVGDPDGNLVNIRDEAGQLRSENAGVLRIGSARTALPLAALLFVGAVWGARTLHLRRKKI